MADKHYRALVCTHWGHWNELELQALQRPVLAPGQVRIRVRHAGIGFALSLFVAGTYQRRPPLPFTPGTEVAGEIMEVAPDVRQLRPDLRTGQRVIAALDWGALAQEAVALAHTVYALPDAVPLCAAAALPITYATSWSALQWAARLQAGESVLVHGASGGLGMAAVQIASHLGAQVIATASTEEKRSAALAHGAAHALPSDAVALPTAVKALCPAGGAQVVFDPVGGDLADASLRCMAPGGRLLAMGFASGRIPQFPANLLLVKNLGVLGFNYGRYIGWGLTDERAVHAPAVQALVGQITQAVASGAIAAPRTMHFPLPQWQQALDTTMSRRAVGKVILDF